MTATQIKLHRSAEALHLANIANRVLSLGVEQSSDVIAKITHINYYTTRYYNTLREIRKG